MDDLVGEDKVLVETRQFKSRAKLKSSVAALAFAALALGGCTVGETFTQGYVIDQATVDAVPVGSSREQVQLALGSPSTTASFDNEVYYYVSQTRRRSVAFQKPTVVDQRVLAVYFGKDGRVSNVANYGLKEGQVFDFISRTTPTGGREQGFLIQMISGLGGGKNSNVRMGLPGT